MAFFLDSIDHCRSHKPDDEGQATLRSRTQALRKRNDTVNAFVHIGDEPAHNAITATNPAALLAGVPIAVKDLIDVAGMPTRLGSQAVSHAPEEHAAVIDALVSEGAIIAGKSHTTEFAMSGWGVSPLGRPLNPIDADDLFFSGGSSNGSASAVAAGLVPAALGTDTGGSVRIPSSWCGITGLKGSPGWVSTVGVAPLSQSFDVVGPMARTASEVGQLYRAMLPALRRTAFETALEVATQQPLPTLMFLDDASLGVVDSNTLAAYRASQTQCAAQGFPIKMTTIPRSFAEMAGVWAGISAVEGYLNNRELVDDPAAPLDDGVRTNFLQGSKTDLHGYWSLLNKARHIREAMDNLLTPSQVLVVPTTATPATRLTEFDPLRTLGIYTRFVNLIQGCAIAIPNGISHDARPTSMQFVGSYGQDAVILHAATHWQAHTDWHAKIRDLHAEQMQRRTS
ncbi:amidase [Candidimonas sp. SYP-B2681]|uniref:amidase n=1 Tax=Candidimonas sp. SYP-B2681 TaxID=2497686 RepID=UPI0013158E01|nr:amidase [Candidimonas sp. SYP-B2681]